MDSQLLFMWLNSTADDMYSGIVDTGLKSSKGSSYFTSLTTELNSCETDYTGWLVARAAAVDGSKADRNKRDVLRDTLNSDLRPLLNKINAIANGDDGVLIASGFPMRSTNRTPIGPLGAPATPVCKQGKISGVLLAATKQVYGASLYTAQLALASKPDVIIETQQQTGVRFEFDGLTAGELYNVQMNAIGAAGASDWSDVGTLRVV